MKTINLSLLIFTAVCLLTNTSCNKNDEPLPAGNSLNLTNGVFIVNEGNFGSGDGSVTFFRTTSHEVIEDVFKTANNRPLGDVVQSIILHGNRAFVVVNNSQKIEVVNKNNFESIGTINGFTAPRFFLPVNASYAYVSDWFANNIKVVDMNSLTITDSIPAGNGPEQMTLSNNKVYVANIGGWDIDSTVTVIDATSNSVTGTIQTALNPNSIVTDANGKIWVLCNGWYGPDFTGGTADDVAGALIRINPANNSVEQIFTMGQYEHPFKLTCNKEKTTLYYLMGVSGYNGDVYRFDISSASLPASPIIIKNFYGLGIDPDHEEIYGAYSPVFGQSGYMFRYDHDGTFKDSTKVGVGPNGFAFNY